VSDWRSMSACLAAQNGIDPYHGCSKIPTYELLNSPSSTFLSFLQKYLEDKYFNLLGELPVYDFLATRRGLRLVSPSLWLNKLSYLFIQSYKHKNRILDTMRQKVRIESFKKKCSVFVILVSHCMIPWHYARMPQPCFAAGLPSGYSTYTVSVLLSFYHSVFYIVYIKCSKRRIRLL